MNIFKILSTAVYAILTVLAGMVAYLYVVTELHSDTFVGICAFMVSGVFMVMIYFSIRWIVVDAYPKIKKSGTKLPMPSPPPENRSVALERVEDYTRNDLSEFIRKEDIPVFLKIGEDFVNRAMKPTTFNVDRNASGLSPMDILHYGRNLKTLSGSKWTGLQVSRFLKRAFPVILANWSEGTVKSKLTSDDGTYKITLLSERA